MPALPTMDAIAPHDRPARAGAPVLLEADTLCTRDLAFSAQDPFTDAGRIFTPTSSPLKETLPSVDLTSPEGSPREGTRWISTLGFFLGVAFLVLTLVLPPPTGLDPAGWRVAGIGLLMAALWISEAVPLAVTALIPLVLFPAMEIASIEEAAAPFANPIIFLFLGGFMLAQAMQRWDLHRRVALWIIGRTGTEPRRLVGGFMMASAFLSMWVSNTAVAVMMLPIGVSVIQVTDRRGGDSFPIALLLGIAYGASIGGLATLIGTPPNALLAGFLAQNYGLDLGFGRWMLVGLPMTLVLLPSAWFVLTRVAFSVEGAAPEGHAAPTLYPMGGALGAISLAERRVALIFGATALAWIFRPLLNPLVPGISDAGIAILATLLLFLIPSGQGRGERLLNWDWARRIPWDILLLFGGGLSLAGAISTSGLADWLGHSLHGAAALPLILTILLVTGLLIFLTELTSNTASAAAFIPIVAGLAGVLAVDPLLLAVPATIAASCAFMLPVATPPNAIIFGSTLVPMRAMVRAGFLLNLLSMVLIPLIVLLFVPFLTP